MIEWTEEDRKAVRGCLDGRPAGLLGGEPTPTKFIFYGQAVKLSGDILAALVPLVEARVEKARAEGRAEGVYQYADDLAANESAVDWTRHEFVNDAYEYAEFLEREASREDYPEVKSCCSSLGACFPTCSARFDREAEDYPDAEGLAALRENEKGRLQ